MSAPLWVQDTITFFNKCFASSWFFGSGFYFYKISSNLKASLEFERSWTIRSSSYNHLPVLWPLRRPDQRQWAFHLCSSRCRGQVPQRRQLGLLPLFTQQSAVPVVTVTLRHVRRDAVRPEPLAGGLQEQPLPQPAAQRHRWPHHGVQPGPARQQVHTRANITAT